MKNIVKTNLEKGITSVQRKTVPIGGGGGNAVEHYSDGEFIGEYTIPSTREMTTEEVEEMEMLEAQICEALEANRGEGGRVSYPPTTGRHSTRRIVCEEGQPPRKA